MPGQLADPGASLWSIAPNQALKLTVARQGGFRAVPRLLRRAAAA
jgi:hypothetical protein